MNNQTTDEANKKMCSQCKDLRYEKELGYYCSSDSESIWEGCGVKPDADSCEFFECIDNEFSEKERLIESLNEIEKVWDNGKCLVDFETVIDCINNLLNL